MSIVIVTPQVANPATTPAASAQNTDNSATAEFSSVLTTQQTAAALAAPLGATSGGRNAANALTEVLSNLSNQTTDESNELASADAGAILAALGVIPTPIQPITTDASNSKTPPPDTLAKALTAAGNAPYTGSDSTTPPQQDSKTSAADNPRTLGINVDSNVPGAQQSMSMDDAAAKIAVSDNNLLQEKLPTSTSIGETNPTFAAQLQSAHVTGNNRLERSDSPLEIRSRIHEAGWQGEFTQKLTWMASNDKHSAVLTLNPPQLGPVEVSLKIDNGNAAASFVSASQEVREAIESAMPRLKEMLASAGIDLGQTSVGTQSFAQQQAEYEGRERRGSPLINDNDILTGAGIGPLSTTIVMTRRGSGMVDLFA